MWDTYLYTCARTSILHLRHEEPPRIDSISVSVATTIRRNGETGRIRKSLLITARKNE